MIRFQLQTNPKAVEEMLKEIESVYDFYHPVRKILTDLNAQETRDLIWTSLNSYNEGLIYAQMNDSQRTIYGAVERVIEMSFERVKR